MNIVVRIWLSVLVFVCFSVFESLSVSAISKEKREEINYLTEMYINFDLSDTLDRKTIFIEVTNNNSKPIYIQKSGRYYLDEYDFAYSSKLTLKNKPYVKVKPKSTKTIPFASQKKHDLFESYSYVKIGYKYGNNSPKTKIFYKYVMDPMMFF